jgi:hypothetical protein
MKQVVQNFRTGELKVEDLASASAQTGWSAGAYGLHAHQRRDRTNHRPKTAQNSLIGKREDGRTWCGRMFDTPQT